jgi:hypothetical protein
MCAGWRSTGGVSRSSRLGAASSATCASRSASSSRSRAFAALLNLARLQTVAPPSPPPSPGGGRAGQQEQLYSEYDIVLHTRMIASGHDAQHEHGSERTDRACISPLSVTHADGDRRTDHYADERRDRSSAVHEVPPSRSDGRTIMRPKPPGAYHCQRARWFGSNHLSPRREPGDAGPGPGGLAVRGPRSRRRGMGSEHPAVATGTSNRTGTGQAARKPGPTPWKPRPGAPRHPWESAAQGAFIRNFVIWPTMARA